MGSLIGENNISYNTGPHLFAHRIPNELWSMIFIRCLPTSTNSDPPRYPRKGRVITDPRLTPVLLASVCQVWRHIACGTSKLWMSCWVNFVHPELNTAWLRRAGTRMLHLYGRYHESYENEFRWEPLILSILPFHKRWKTLELEVGKWGIMNIIPEFDTPELETFKVSDYNEVPVWMAGLLSNAPRLRELELDYVWFGLPLGISLEYQRFPNLSTLRVHMIIPCDVLEILSMLPQLLHLSFNLDDEDNSFLELPIVTHTNLLSLEIDGDLSALLDNLIIPSLQIFHTRSGYEFDTFLDFVERSQCRIIELRIHDINVLSVELIMTLQHNSISRWLEKLELIMCLLAITPELLDLLRYTPNNRYLPHLTQLLFHYCRFEDTPDGLVADVIASRCGSLACECNECCARPQARDVRLQYVLIEWLDRAKHSLDIGRMVPLSLVRLVASEDAVMIVDLVPVEVVPTRIGDTQNEHPVKLCFGNFPLCHNDLDSDL